MRIQPVEETIFTLDDPSSARGMAQQAMAEAGGWVNLTPLPDPGTPPTRRNLFLAIFSSRGPDLPLATLSATAPTAGRISLGLQHPGGVKAIARLATSGLDLPPGWLAVTDHPRRGLVVTAPDTATDQGLDWLLRAALVLASGPLPSRWVARRYRP